METLWETLTWRGFYYQCTNELLLQKKFESETVTAYVGVDPTAESLHIGHFVPLYLLCHLAQAGHKPIVVLGAGTAKIGDPSGKISDRRLLQNEELQHNTRTIKKQIQNIFARLQVEAQYLDNSDWLDGLLYIDFMRTIGCHFSVNRMLSFETYKKRLETGLSFLEFNYQLLQSYDFLHLFENYNCHLQCGGADQWANIVAGSELIRRIHGKETVGFTLPLITRSDGSKMGKTEEGAIFVDPTLTSTFDFFQYWRNADDSDLIKFLKLYTFLPRNEINLYLNLKAEQLNLIKEILAFNVTAIIHGKEAAQEALRAARAAFARANTDQINAQINALLNSSEISESTRSLLQEMRKLSDSSASEANIPTFWIDRAQLEEGMNIIDLYLLSGLSKSKGEARRLIEQRGARIFDAVIDSSELQLDTSFLQNDEIILRFGKKKLMRVCPK